MHDDYIDGEEAEDSDLASDDNNYDPDGWTDIQITQYFYKHYE